MKRFILSAALLVPTTALAGELPTRKSGLWEITTSMAGMSQKMKQCTDAQTDKAMMNTGKEMNEKMGGSCAKNEINKVGDTYVAEADCTMSGARVISKTVFSGDFNTKYSAKTKTTMEPAVPGMPEMEGTISAKWIGPCDEGMSPGDVVMANGMKMNMAGGMKTLKGPDGKPLAIPGAVK